MNEFKSFELHQLNDYLRNNTTPQISNGIINDVAHALPDACPDTEVRVQHYLLGARARPVAMDLFLLAVRWKSQRKQLSYLVKSAHNFTEPERSRRAAQYGLGPPLIGIDKNLICEKFLNRDDRWRTAKMRIDTITAKRLGCRLAEKLLLMFSNNLNHAFDDFPEHTFILYSQQDVDVRWVDWGKPFSFDFAARNSQILIEGLVAVLLNELRNMVHAEVAYRQFKLAISRRKLLGLPMLQIIRNVENAFTKADYPFCQQWKAFLLLVGQLVDSNCNVETDFDLHQSRLETTLAPRKVRRQYLQYA